MSGWYKQQRSLLERAWFKDPNAVQLYVCLKSMAYVTDGHYSGTIIRRGSCPVTRAEMIEATGMKYMKLDRCLKKLISYGEIIVKANSRFSIVTICDYDGLDQSNVLFDAYSEQPMNNKRTTDEISNETTDEISNEITHISTIEERIKKEDILVSSFSSYKKEKESGDLALEVKKRYNKTFDGMLPPCIRLTLPTRLMVEDCIKRFGMQSVDIVFRQVLMEPFSLGQNKTGFMANFQFLFTPRNFQQYLERAQLRQKKSPSPAPAQQDPEASAPEALPQTPKEKFLSIIELAATHPNPRKAIWWKMLVDAHRSGQLASLGIDWTPDSIVAPSNSPIIPTNSL